MIPREEIIKAAMQAFLEEGVRDVTMDDIAQRLHMSKRTLYQLFHDKEELLLECLKLRVSEEEAYHAQLGAETSNVIDVLVSILARHLRDMQCISPDFYDELKRYRSVQAFHVQQCEKNAKLAVEFMQRGVEQGYFMAGINYDFVIHQLLNTTSRVLDSATRFGMTLQDVFQHTVLLYLRGCATLRGAALLDDFCIRHESEAATLFPPVN